MSFAENLSLSFCSEEDGDKMKSAKALISGAFLESTAVSADPWAKACVKAPRGQGVVNLNWIH